MTRFTFIGQLFIAIALFAFGVQHFIYLDFVTRAFPAIPQWIPAHGIFACLFGTFLCLTAAAIISNIKARETALLLATSILIGFAVLQLPALIMNPMNGFIWTISGKVLVIAGVTLIAASSLRVEKHQGLSPKLEKLIPLGGYFLSGFFILAAIMHFIYPDFVAALIPNWIPAHIFWTYFAAIALIAGGIGMHIPRTAQLAATLSALMVFIWVITLHLPRALADLHNANETTSMFEALAMCGGCILMATRTRKP